MFPGLAERLHWSLPDPAAVAGSDAVRLETFRQVRDALEAGFREWLRTQPL